MSLLSIFFFLASMPCRGVLRSLNSGFFKPLSWTMEVSTDKGTPNYSYHNFQVDISSQRCDWGFWRAWWVPVWSSRLLVWSTICTTAPWFKCHRCSCHWKGTSSYVIPAKPLHNHDIVSVHFNNFHYCTDICNKPRRYLAMFTFIYLNVDGCWLISSMS